jgi:hypothetical protein
MITYHHFIDIKPVKLLNYHSKFLCILATEL